MAEENGIVSPETQAPESEGAEEFVEEEEESSEVSASGGQSGENSLKEAAKEVMDTVEGADADEDDDSEDEESDKPKEKKKAEEKKSWKLKVGGKEVEIKDEQELLKRAQMGYSADEKWQEAAKIRKQVEGFLGELQSNPASALQKIGLDPDDFAERHIQSRIEEMEKSPEQLEREKLQKEIEDLRKQQEDSREQARQAEIQRMQDQYATQIENEITDALGNSKSLPKSPYVVKRMADMLILAMENGHKDISPKDILPVVEQDIKREISEMFSVMPEDMFEAVVGKETLNKYRKNRVKRAKKAPKTTVKDVKPTGEAEKNKSADSKNNKKDQKPMRQKDFFKNLGTL